MFQKRLVSALTLIAAIAFTLPASAKRAKAGTSSQIGKDAELLKQCSIDKSKCCATERKKYCQRKKRKDSCLLGLIYKVNATNGDYKPPRYDLSDDG